LRHAASNSKVAAASSAPPSSPPPARPLQTAEAAHSDAWITAHGSGSLPERTKARALVPAAARNRRWSGLSPSNSLICNGFRAVPRGRRRLWMADGRTIGSRASRAGLPKHHARRASRVT
jgi:hypothetical protein